MIDRIQTILPHQMMGYKMYNVKENKITEDSERANHGGVQERIFDEYDYAV